MSCPEQRKIMVLHQRLVQPLACCRNRDLVSAHCVQTYGICTQDMGNTREDSIRSVSTDVTLKLTEWRCPGMHAVRIQHLVYVQFQGTRSPRNTRFWLMYTNDPASASYATVQLCHDFTKQARPTLLPCATLSWQSRKLSRTYGDTHYCLVSSM